MAALRAPTYLGASYGEWNRIARTGMFCHARACVCVCTMTLGWRPRSWARFGQRLPCRRSSSAARVLGRDSDIIGVFGRLLDAQRPPSVRITPGNVGGAPTPSESVFFARAVSRTHPALCSACDQFHPLAFPARLKTLSFMQSTEYKMFPRGRMSVGDRDEREARGGSELCEPQVSGELAPGLMVVLTGPNERSRE